MIFFENLIHILYFVMAGLVACSMLKSLFKRKKNQGVGGGGVWDRESSEEETACADIRQKKFFLWKIWGPARDAG